MPPVPAAVEVSIVMPVYNAQYYVGRAIESMLSQSFTALEFIIIDDCSTDQSLEVILSFEDERIHLLKNDTNRGLAYSLNRGIATANGRLIARMDADDISLPQRIEAQVAFMDKNPGIGMCGTYIKLIGSRNETMKYYTEDAHIKANLIFETGMAHPAVMMRKHIIEKHQLSYQTNFQVAQDYELWTRAAQFISFANLPQVFLHYYVHDQSVSGQRTIQQVDTANQIRMKQLQRMGLIPSRQELLLHQQVCLLTFPRRLTTVKQIERWLTLLLWQNEDKQVHDQRALREVIGDWWFKVCRASTGNGVALGLLYCRSPLATRKKALIRVPIILVKCLLRSK